MKKFQKGYTFVELIVVLLIIGVLAAVAIPTLIDASSQATTKGCIAFKGAVETSAIMNFDMHAMDPTLGTSVIGKTCVAAVYSLMENGQYADSFGIFSVDSTKIQAGYNTCEIYANGVDTNKQVHIRAN